MSQTNFDIHKHITAELIQVMEQGVKPWQLPFDQSIQLPMNYQTGEKYNGINIVLLWIAARNAGFQSPYWLTFNQIKSKGGKVNKGEKSTMIIFYKTKEIEEDGETKTIPIIKYYRVFNIQQTDIKIPKHSVNKIYDQVVEADYNTISNLIVDNLGVSSINHDSGSAYYQPKSDSIHLPDKSLFFCSKEMFATLIHEAIHATGHKSRLDRFSGKNNRYGSYDYSVEEIIAESASVFVLAELGIQSDFHGHASYIDSWIKNAKEDKKFLFKVFSDASKAANYFMDMVYPKSIKSAA